MLGSATTMMACCPGLFALQISFGEGWAECRLERVKGVELAAPGLSIGEENGEPRFSFSDERLLEDSLAALGDVATTAVVLARILDSAVLS